MPEILMCGSEGEQVLFENTLDALGADDKRRGSVHLVLGDQMFKQFDAAVSDFWFHVRLAAKFGTGSALTGQDVVRISNGSTVLARIFSVPVVGGSLNSFRFDVGSGTNGPTFPAASLQFINYDIRVQVSGGALTVSFYRDEVLRHTATIGTGFPNGPDRILVQYQNDATSYAEIYVQDMIATDAIPTVGMELATVVPSALGNFDDFTNDYTAIDDLGYNQSSAIASFAAGERESWFFSDPEFDIGDKVIFGLVINTVAQSDVGGVVDDFNAFVRIGATNYDAANMGANAISPNAFVTLFATNPSTTAPWTSEELLGLEAGVRSVSV
jgi:hypothetical protein